MSKTCKVDLQVFLCKHTEPKLRRLVCDLVSSFIPINKATESRIIKGVNNSVTVHCCVLFTRLN